jgi:hypothetical protein
LLPLAAEPDGRSIAVVVIRADVAKNKWLPELNLVDVSTGAIRPLTHDRKGVSHPRWSAPAATSSRAWTPS